MAQPPHLKTGTSAPPVSGEIIITCSCGKQMRAPATAFGQTGKCALCGRSFQATAENTTAAPPREAPAEVRPAAPAAAPKAAPAQRIESLDQLRGYAIAGMIVVNYLGGFAVMPWFFGHQRDTYSYADTIAPLFVFVVGMGFRLSLKRRAEKEGIGSARWHSLKRYLVLFLVAVVFYGPDYTKDWWDALTQIALAGVLTLPLIDKPLPVRAAGAWLYLAAYMFFFLGTGYGSWLQAESMNGGPLGVLNDAFVLLLGTIAYDLLASDDHGAIVKWSLVWGIGLIAAAFVIWTLMPKDLPAYAEYGSHWPFSKRWGAAPFVCLSAGLAFLAFLFFYVVVDRLGYTVPTLTILGENPLIIYLIQYSLLEIHGSYLPESVSRQETASAFVLAILGFALFYGFCYAVARRLHRDRIIIKL